MRIQCQLSYVHVAHVILRHTPVYEDCLCWVFFLLHNLTKIIGDISVQICVQSQELRCRLKLCSQLTRQVEQLSTAFVRSVLIDYWLMAVLSVSIAKFQGSLNVA